MDRRRAGALRNRFRATQEPGRAAGGGGAGNDRRRRRIRCSNRIRLQPDSSAIRDEGRRSLRREGQPPRRRRPLYRGRPAGTPPSPWRSGSSGGRAKSSISRRRLWRRTRRFWDWRAWAAGRSRFAGGWRNWRKRSKSFRRPAPALRLRIPRRKSATLCDPLFTGEARLHWHKPCLCGNCCSGRWSITVRSMPRSLAALRSARRCWAGALLVGDSVRGSLRGLTLDRLGAIDHALVAERYFRPELASEIAGFDRVSAGVLIRGSVENAQTGARASKVNIHGVDETFWVSTICRRLRSGRGRSSSTRCWPASWARRTATRSCCAFRPDTLVPAESVMGRKTDNVRLLRLKGREDSGQPRAGTFRPLAESAVAVQRFRQPRRSAAGSGPAGARQCAFCRGRQRRRPPRVVRRGGFFRRSGNRGSPLDGRRQLAVQTGRIVLERHAAEWIADAAEAAELDSVQALTYLANAIDSGGRSIPYSTVTALERLPAGLRLAGGAAPPALAATTCCSTAGRRTIYRRNPATKLL